MNKYLILLILLLALIPTTIGVECGTIINPSANCDVLTFAVNKSNEYIFDGNVCNITTYTPAGIVDDDEVAMTNGTRGVGWHNFTFTKSTLGSWTGNIQCKGEEQLESNTPFAYTVGFNRVGLVADAVNSSTVGSSVLDGERVGLVSDAVNTSTLSDDTITTTKIATDAIGSDELAASAVTEIQSGLSTYAQVSTVNSSLRQAVKGNSSAVITQGDFAWTTATGFSTYSQASTINTTTLDIQGGLRGNDTLWVTATGFSTYGQVNTINSTTLNTNQAIVGNSSSWANTTSTGNISLASGEVNWIGSAAANYTFAQKLNGTSWIADRWTLPWMVYSIYRFP